MRHQYYKTSPEEKWKRFPLILPIWRREINLETRIWNKTKCRLYPDSYCKSPENCGDDVKIKDSRILSFLIKRRELSNFEIILLSISLFSISFLTVNFTLVEISSPSFNTTINYYPTSSQIGDQVVNFTVAVINQRHKWAFSGDDSLVSGLTIDVFPSLFAKMRKDGKLSDWKGIVAVGMASEEGTILAEERRAELRASEIMRQLYPYTPRENTRLFLLNLGKFAEDTNLEEDETGIQRLAVVIGIHSMPANTTDTDLTNALRMGLKNLKDLDVQVEQYSQFKLTESSINQAI